MMLRSTLQRPNFHCSQPDSWAAFMKERGPGKGAGGAQQGGAKGGAADPGKGKSKWAAGKGNKGYGKGGGPWRPWSSGGGNRFAQDAQFVTHFPLLAEAPAGQNSLSTPPSVAHVVSFAGTHTPGVDGAAVLPEQSAQSAEQRLLPAQRPPSWSG